ncbi:DUF4240 domain-containing protein [Goodfellowiella coeruleoviolacea]|uniref:DUF4240 domain-containing protein n=1 Tax=Goodfellowiella coeruleoviolacea TaxID=334858 RepID=A0AAE3GBC1_9PSEU|nr:DUF4240 domain-containing protein [Goodfellowiella coeruleoviolacea]MCP2165161.1 Protein of unknown function (DUF4240) [Goodfellowiella coeruleoviolacea]
MTIEQFWRLIDQARAEVVDTTDADAVADRAAALLATRPVAEIVAAQRPLDELLAVAYRARLWAAAYLINDGCSDDGFDYFRGWLIAQGREVFERVVAEPDRLAELPAVQAAAQDQVLLEAESVLAVPWEAHQTATGQDMPPPRVSVQLPELDRTVRIDDERSHRQHLPRLAELFLD